MRIVIIIAGFLFSSISYAQQVANWSTYYENGFIWNPALTARWNSVETAITHRKDWSGFENGPEYSTLAFQFPFISVTPRRSGLGVYIDRDKVGPFSVFGFAATYAYGFSPQLSGKVDDVLAIGFKANVSRYSFDETRILAFSDEVDEGISTTLAGKSLIRPNLSIGVFYNSVSDFYAYQKSHYYFGLSVNNFIPFKMTKYSHNGESILTVQNITAQPNAGLHLGYRIIPFRRATFYYEPNIMVIYAFSKAIHAMANFRYESFDKFWISAGGSTDGEIFSQVGVIFNKKSFLHAIVGDGSLRLGAKIDYHLGSLAKYKGIGYEFYGSYIFELDPD